MAGNRGDFAVSRDHVTAIADQYGVIEACHYILYCCGRKGLESRTQWSKASFYRYCSVTKGRARESEATLIEGGFVTKVRDGKHPIFEIQDSNAAGHIWLPKTFIMGANDEVPPLRLLVQTACPDTLLLLLEVYWRNNVAEDGCCLEVSVSYEGGDSLADCAQFSVRGFTRTDRIDFSLEMGAALENPSEALTTLLDLGLVLEVPFAFSCWGGEPLFPLIHPYTRQIVYEVTDAAYNRLPDEYNFLYDEYEYVLLLPRHMKHPVLRGGFVPRYVQQTELSKAGLYKTNERIQNWVSSYQRYIKE